MVLVRGRSARARAGLLIMCGCARAQASSARRQKSQNNFRQLNIKRKVPNRLSQSKIFLLDFDPEVIFFRVNPSQWFEFNLIFYDFLVPEKDVQVLISVSSKSDRILSQEIIDLKKTWSFVVIHQCRRFYFFKDIPFIWLFLFRQDVCNSLRLWRIKK